MALRSGILAPPSMTMAGMLGSLASTSSAGSHNGALQTAGSGNEQSLQVGREDCGYGPRTAVSSTSTRW